MIFKRSSNKKNELFLTWGGQKSCCASPFFGVFSHSPIAPHPFHVTTTTITTTTIISHHHHHHQYCALPPSLPPPTTTNNTIHYYYTLLLYTTTTDWYTTTTIWYTTIYYIPYCHDDFCTCKTFALHLPKITYF